MKKICLFILFNMCFVVMKAQVTSGSNDYMSWELSEDGVLTIGVNEYGGTDPWVYADMPDYTDYGYWDSMTFYEEVGGCWYPWYSYRDKIKTIVIGDRIRRIGDYAFSRCENLTSVILPESLEFIEGHSFRECNNLKSINIPESVHWIGIDAFYGCEKLEYVKLPSEMYNEDDWWDHYCFGPFRNCPSLTSIVIPNSVHYINYSAFQGCSSLTSVSFPNSITSFEYDGTYMFNGCTSLKSINIPDTIKVIGYSMFMDCESLESTSISNKVTKIDGNAFHGCSSLTSFTFPDSLEYIGDDAFSNCRLLPAINIGKKLTYIGKDAFWFTNNLSSIEVDEENKIFDSRQNCNAIIKTETNELILGCNNTIIPNTVTSIGKRAFSFKKNESIDIPNSVTSIGEDAFYHCEDLKSVNIGNSVKTIGKGAFQGCSSLKTIRIPESVTSIGSDAFAIDDHYNIFYTYDYLDTIYCEAIVPPAISMSTFWEYYSVLIVPQGSLEAYKTAPYWSKFFKIIENDPVSIQEAMMDNKNDKENGNDIYSLQGTRLNAAPSKGIYIKDKKKYISR